MLYQVCECRNQGRADMSDYFEGLKLAQRIGVPCRNCATSSIWCERCAQKWRKACEDTARQVSPPNAAHMPDAIERAITGEPT
jgi:hypothetical protein